AGEKVVQATLGWDPVGQKIDIQRLKEDAHQYRYFPEPDILPFKIERSLVERVRATVPELEDARRARFQSELKLSAYDATILAAERPVADYFEAAVKAFGGTPKTIANWMTNDVFALMRDKGLSIEQVKTTPAQLAALVGLVDRKEVNGNSAKAVLADVIETG